MRFDRTTDEQLVEAFTYLGRTVFTAYFLNYAGTAIQTGIRKALEQRRPRRCAVGGKRSALRCSRVE